MKEKAVTILVLFLPVVHTGVYAQGLDMQNIQFVNEWVTASTNVHFNKKFCSECHLKEAVAGGNISLRFGRDYVQIGRAHV